ncbi:hypothetical protein LTR16_010921, partial [Cryomyces antarcticus]
PGVLEKRQSLHHPRHHHRTRSQDRRAQERVYTTLNTYRERTQAQCKVCARRQRHGCRTCTAEEVGSGERSVFVRVLDAAVDPYWRRTRVQCPLSARRV